EPNHEVVARRQDSFQREIMVLVLAGKLDQAIGYLENNFFHAQEGREDIHDLFVDAHLLEGLRLLKAGSARQAFAHFLKADEYPENLSVGRPKDDPRSAQIAWFTATACEALGDSTKAGEFYLKAADQKQDGGRQEMRFYQAMSLAKLGQNDESRKIFDDLVATGRKRLEQGDSADFFAKFGEQKTRQASAASAHFLTGLGLLGQGKTAEAQKAFQQAAAMNAADPWAAHYASQ
ncbi:MAG: tetratricopeptide repeat protein, partial [Thermoguttaceae bacterium]